jgi:pimeloyl-ACP methyl ester carboxylesterase
MRASALAPELKVLGVAGIAPVSDLNELVQASKGSIFGKIISSYILTAYARAYPDVRLEDYASPASRLVARDIASRCIDGYQARLAVLASKLLPKDGLFSKDPGSGYLRIRLDQNTPRGSVPMPLLIAQGEADDLILPGLQRRYVQERCSRGQQIDYRTYPDRDHVSLVSSDSPLAAELIEWTRDRLDGKVARNTCPS